ncbi:MMPL family transporter [Nocardia sp. NEAU-G5]|uniref:MMPL family transporter n=1 Tax=Nocardia albiluteola TaxID=2842303 RepID=A0ABS6B7J3_9NOCA|nr:MMPL family transporter [Nocardia albiluteola]MBU3066219.1 MMPL family transporter [Nocardia albiluteola]
MFTRWGDLVYRFRFAVLGVMVAGLLGLGAFGLNLADHLSSSGWDDPGSESTQAAEILDSTYGRDHAGDVIVLYTAPDGKTVDDPAFQQTVVNSLNNLPKNHPDQISRVYIAPWKVTGVVNYSPTITISKDRKVAFATIALKGDDDTSTMQNFREVKDAFDIPGVNVQVAGLQAVAGTLNDTIAEDIHRMEILAIPAVAVLLFFIFGGVVAAALPLIVGGLTVIGANGIVMGITKLTDVNSFVGAVVSMVGLGLAIDYGLFIVSRFREELADGYDTRAAVRRSVMTAGRTVAFSATMIIAASASMLLFPQGFLKSLAYGTIATVGLAALASLTILPAILSILGRRVDMLGLKWFRKTKTTEEIENGLWGRCVQWVMKHPLKVAVPLCILLLLLIIPVKNLQFGGISETYLPPDNPTRMAQAEFDRLFPERRTDPINLVIETKNTTEISGVLAEANKAPGLVGHFQLTTPPPSGSDVWQVSTTIQDPAHPSDTIDYLRSIPLPADVQLLVGGSPAVMMDSVNALLNRMPLMIILVVLITTLLMFLTFGSLVLPIKAALMSALGLGSTLGILTWIFIDGHGAGLMNFTPQPITAPVLVLIIALIYGLSIDYEVFLLSRMVEARAQGASTTEAVRIGTAQTGRIITAAALILLVVTGAFAFSKLVMMQYIAYGMVSALLIDATVLRMLLVPATMKLLGDDCWWAPAWMKRIQQKVGLGEPILDDARPQDGEVVDLIKTTPVTDPVTMQIPMMPDGTPVKQGRKPRRPRFLRHVDPEAPTERIAESPAVESDADAAQGLIAPAAEKPQPGQSTLNLPDATAPVESADVSASPAISPPRQPGRPAVPSGLPDAGVEHAAGEAPRDPGAAPRILPPRPTQTGPVPPHPATRAQRYQPHETDPANAAPLTAATEPVPATELHRPQADSLPRADYTRPPVDPPQHAAPAAHGESPRHVAPRPASATESSRPQDADRSSIEQWMADLRSSRRRSLESDPDEGKHHDSGNRTVSVNELLRRQNRES